MMIVQVLSGSVCPVVISGRNNSQPAREHPIADVAVMADSEHLGIEYTLLPRLKKRICKAAAVPPGVKH